MICKTIKFLSQKFFLRKNHSTATRQTGILSQVFHYIKTWWPSHIDEVYKPFFYQEHELSIEAGWLLWRKCHYLYKAKILLGGKATQRSSRSMRDERCRKWNKLKQAELNEFLKQRTHVSQNTVLPKYGI